MDLSLPVSGVTSRIDSGVLVYLQTIDLFGRTTNLIVEQPYSRGTTKGLLFDEPAQRDFSSFADLNVTLGVNLLGAPSMTPAEFQTFLKVLAPTGQYDSARLINVGANRWAVRPKLGFLLPMTSKWVLELEAAVWLIADNNKFLPGRREQAPIYAAEAHVVRRIRPGFWTSIEANYFVGGQQTIGRVQLDDALRNSRIGGTIVVPFRHRQSIKAGYSTSLVTRFGSDFNRFIVGYQVLIG